MRRYIGIIGEGVCDKRIGEIAYRAGAAIAKSGATLVCGGMGGVMQFACKGAKDSGGVTIGILPMDDRTGANPYLDYSIPTGMGEARNVVVVRASDAIIAIGGSYGTLSEIAFTLKFGKPIIGIGTWELKDSQGEKVPIKIAGDPETAVSTALDAVGCCEGI